MAAFFKIAMLLVGLTVLAGCGPAQNDPGPGGVTVGEAKALDEAVEMLDERNAPPKASDLQPEHPQSEQP